jgi:hypothetical protein
MAAERGEQQADYEFSNVPSLTRCEEIMTEFKSELGHKFMNVNWKFSLQIRAQHSRSRCVAGKIVAG